MITLFALLQEGAHLLNEYYHNKEESLHAAKVLLCHATQKSLTELVVAQTIHQSEKDLFLALINDVRLLKKPIAYITGEEAFFDILIDTRAPFLIPRPETEFWLNELITFLNTRTYNPLNILDMCTGSGCIAVALALHYKDAHITAIDCDKGACALAQRNAEKHNVAHRMKIITSDLFSNLPQSEKFDLIVSNPPYISIDEYGSLDESVKNWEALHALSDGGDGTRIIKQLIETSIHFLKKGGCVAIELNEYHAKEIYFYAQSLSLYYAIQVIHDQYKKPRALILST